MHFQGMKEAQIAISINEISFAIQWTVESTPEIWKTTAGMEKSS